MLQFLIGPDGNADYKAKILSPDHIGIGRGSRENTGSLSYLWRAARVNIFLKKGNSFIAPWAHIRVSRMM